MIKVAPRVYVETSYPGVNVAAVQTSRGFICIDVPSYPRNARDWVARLQQMSPYPIRYLILTDDHGDRILNSRWMNAPIITHETTGDRLATFDKRYPQAMIDSLVLRDPFRGRELAGGPVEAAAITFSDDMRLDVDGHSFVFRHRPGPRPGSLWLHLPESDLLFAGDHLVTDGIPPLGEAQLDVWQAVWDNWQPPLSQVNCIVPGRGPIPQAPEAASEHVALLGHLQDVLNDHISADRSRAALEELLPAIMEQASVNPEGRDWTRHLLLEGLQAQYDRLRPTPANMPIDAAPSPEQSAD